MAKYKSKIFTLCLFTILFLTFYISFYSNDCATYNDKTVYTETYSNYQLLSNSFVNTSDDIPEGSVKISDAEDLKNFLSGDEPYGYVTTDILLDWEDVGSPINFANGRTIDGRGHVLTLTDKQACADVYDDEFEAFSNGEGEASECNYGLFVSVNYGVIKNFKFAYADEICAVNNGDVEINGVGIVCGENNGVITNCELAAKGKFSYFYINGEADYGDGFQTHFGGFAGINRGSIDKVSASYDTFTLRLRTTAHSWDYFGDGMDAKTFAGGVAGSISDSGECTNSIIFGSDVIFNLTADKLGNRESCVYSGAVTAYSEGKVDNIITDFSPEYQFADDISILSKNAVVYCGSATNVTALNDFGGGINLRSNNCDCAEHIGYCNTITTDRFTQAVVYIDDDNNQVVTLLPIKGSLESVSFTKLAVDSSGKIIDDTSLYENSPENFNSQDFASEWIYGKTFQITPYQNSSDCFWEIEARSWQKVEIDFSPNAYFNYTGQDMLQEIVKLKPSDGESNLNCDFTKMNLLNGSDKIYEAINFGRYILSIQLIEIGDRKFLYYDEENHIMAIAPEDYVSEIHEYYIVKYLVVTADWLEIEDNVKEYDGTDEFDVGKIKWNSKNENVIENLSLLREAIEIKACYSQINAGEEIEIIIELRTQAEEIVIDNQVSEVKGTILRKKVNLTLKYAETTYGDTSIEYHYETDNVIDGDSVDIVFCSNISMPDAQEFRFWIEESEFGNYSIANFDECYGYENGAPVIMHKAVISQLANGEEDFTDLNTQNVKDLQIKFRDVIDYDVFHILDILYYDSVENTYLPIEEINSAGTYKISLSIPKELQLIYELDESLSVMEITVSQVDDDSNDINDSDSDNPSSEIPNEQDNDKTEIGDNIGNDNSQNEYSEYRPSGVEEKSYGGIAIAVGATSTALIAVGILKRVLSKRKLKPRK